jgi:predicted RNase H-like HicB family nuclease
MQQGLMVGLADSSPPYRYPTLKLDVAVGAGATRLDSPTGSGYNSGMLTEYIDAALSEAEFDKLDDGTFAGRIPSCPGVVAFAVTLRSCEHELQAVLEDWLLLGLKLRHRLPVMNGIDLNGAPGHEPLESVQAG